MFSYLTIGANRSGCVNVQEILAGVKIEILSGISSYQRSGESGSDNSIAVVSVYVENVLFLIIFRHAVTFAEPEDNKIC